MKELYKKYDDGKRFGFTRLSKEELRETKSTKKMDIIKILATILGMILWGVLIGVLMFNFLHLIYAITR